MANYAKDNIKRKNKRKIGKCEINKEVNRKHKIEKIREKNRNNKNWLFFDKSVGFFCFFFHTSSFFFML